MKCQLGPGRKEVILMWFTLVHAWYFHLNSNKQTLTLGKAEEAFFKFNYNFLVILPYKDIGCVFQEKDWFQEGFNHGHSNYLWIAISETKWGCLK